MVPQSATLSELSRPLSNDLSIGAESCPSCGLEIPLDKLEEVRGRIALRDRDQTLATTARLEEKYQLERAQAQVQIEAARKAATETEERLKDQIQQLNQQNTEALERHRTEAKAREEQIRAEANEAAEIQIAQRLAALEQSHNEAQAALQARITEIELNKAAAEQQVATLSQTINDLHAEAKKREEEIRTEATKAADATLAERLATVEQSHNEAQATLQARITEIELNKAAAEQQVATLSQTIETLRNTKDGELATITEQHARAISEQREALEKANEAALNTERSKAFEETQKLSNKVNELQRALEKKTNEELGEGAEVDLFEALKQEFPDDRITRIAKGEPGADIRHIVISNGKECGTILYDSKNHKAFRTEHVAKLRTDQLAAKAEHAILSTHKFPQGTRQLHLQEGVLLANPARVVILATLLREHLMHVHMLRLSSIERERKTLALYDFITSERCTHLLGRVEQRCEELLNHQTAEVKWHQKHWQKQGEALRAIQKAKADLGHEINTIIGADDVE